MAILKDMLILSDGIDCEGVFRKSGLESEMTAMKESFHAGKPFVCDNTHSIATMMKVPSPPPPSFLLLFFISYYLFILFQRR